MSLTLLILVLGIWNTSVARAQQPAPPHRAAAGAASQARVREVQARLPLSFEANRGQTDRRVKFLARGVGYNLFLTSDEAVFDLNDPSAALAIKLAGARPNPNVVGLDELPGRTNYFVGGDPAQWHTGVPLYRKVRYEGVYPGVDLIYYGNQRQLEYDFHLAPGTNPKIIRLAFRGARKVSVDAAGDLVLQMPRGEVKHRRPVMYQEVNGVRRNVAGRYVMRGRHEVGFEAGSYDESKPLVIDPVLIYSSYLGGGDWDFGNAIAVDAAGAIYVTGWTGSVNFPTRNTIQPPPFPNPFFPMAGSRGQDVFVTKIDPAAPGDASLVYSTYIGGLSSDEARAIAVDASGHAYIAGWTISFNQTGTPQNEGFPVSPGAFQGALYLPRFGVPKDAFVAKLSPAGDAILYSTYFGGGGTDEAEGLAVDSSGHIYVTGTTESDTSDDGFGATPLPTTPGAYQPTNPVLPHGPGQTAFVAKFDPSGSGQGSLVYSTHLGGTHGDLGKAIAVDAHGDALVAGWTLSTDFPTANALQPEYRVGYNAFASRLSADGSALLYSTYLFGLATAIAVDSSGNAYVTGNATSGLPTRPDAFQRTTLGSGRAPFVAKLDTTQTAEASLVYATYVGAGGHFDGAHAIAVDPEGNAYIAGDTSGPFPTTADALQPSHSGGGDAFVAKLNPTATALLYSTYLGGSRTDVARGVAVDANGTMYVTGNTDSTNFPVASAYQPAYGGSIRDAFVTVIGRPTFGVSGHVTFSGAGLEGVTVSVSGAQPHTTTTGEDGQYSIRLLEEGTYTITPSQTGYVFDPPFVTLNLNQNRTADFTAARPVAAADDRTTSYAVVHGTAPFPHATPSDHNFIARPETPFSFRAGGPLRFNISVTRVVGDVNADGTLVAPHELVSNGVVGAYATLRILAFDVDSNASLPSPAEPERNRVLVNGQDIGPAHTPVYLTGGEGIWTTSELTVPIELLRFGKRNVRGVPTPGVNQIEIRIDEGNAASGEEHWATAIDRASISFEAMAPVIMIHGNGSSGAFFDDWAFTLPFVQQRIPFDNSINMPSAPISEHGSLLRALIPGRAQEFGAKRVHIVAHSKGGLDTRDFLARTIPENFGVLSFTTLATPHHGSVGADYSLDAHEGIFWLSDDPVRALLVLIPPMDAGVPNLRVSFVEQFNARNVASLPARFTVDGETSPIVYYSFAADANIDDSRNLFTGRPNIDRNWFVWVDWIFGFPFLDVWSEIRGTGLPSLLGDPGLPLMDMVHAIMGEVATTSLELRPVTVLGFPTGLMAYGVKEHPTPSFQTNDFLVTLPSARLTERFISVPVVKNNHATVANRNVGAEVIRRIRGVQPIR